MRAPSVALLLALGVLVACNSATGVRTNAGEINGTWSDTTYNLSGTVLSDQGEQAGYQCGYELKMSLRQSGLTFAGTLTGPVVDGQPEALVVCVQRTSFVQYGPYFLNGRITNGTISGDSVAFRAVSVGALWSFSGTINGNSMSGNLSIDVALCGCLTDTTFVSTDTLLVTGHWSATRTGH